MTGSKTRVEKVGQLVERTEGLPRGYPQFLSKLKKDIKAARVRASLSANGELIGLYWHIGKGILERQKKEGWGSKVVDRLSRDLEAEFSNMKGFSSRNLKYMRRLAEAYPDDSFVQRVVAQIPWGHNVRILDRVKGDKQRKWYLFQTIEHGWSRDILIKQIESGLYQRQGRSVTNFRKTLLPVQSNLAHQIFKDPYVFDFMSVGGEALEREVEKELVRHITNFLLELGAGFSFVGQQYHLEVDVEDFYIDLLFYHLKLRCYVVVELKSGKFKPEYAGQLNFYLSAIDAQVKHPDDNPSVGLLLCKDKNKLVAEYALKDISKPVGISEYKIVKSVPEQLKINLPTIEELERELVEG